MLPPPVWIAPRLEKYFENKVVLPYFTSTLYHPDFAPIPYCQAIVGRQGVGKLESIQALLKKANILSTKTINVEFGKTGQAILDIQTSFGASRERSLREGTNSPCHVLVINHADILCYEPDNEKTLLDAIGIAESAKECNTIVLAICDRATGTGGDKSENMTVWARTCQTKFFAQFDSVAFAPAPNAEFRIKYMRWAIDAFAEHCKQQGRKLIIDISDNDYKVLEDYTTYATQRHLMFWMQKIFIAILEDACSIVLDMNLMCEYLGKRMGALHVCDFDARAVEDMYSSSTGAGPIAPVKPAVFQPSSPPGDKLITTTFSTANLDVDEVIESMHPDDESLKRERPTKDAFGVDEFALPTPALAEQEQEEEEEEKPKKPKRKKRSKK